MVYALEPYCTGLGNDRKITDQDIGLQPRCASLRIANQGATTDNAPKTDVWIPSTLQLPSFCKDLKMAHRASKGCGERRRQESCGFRERDLCTGRFAELLIPLLMWNLMVRLSDFGIRYRNKYPPMPNTHTISLVSAGRTNRTHQ